MVDARLNLRVKLSTYRLDLHRVLGRNDAEVAEDSQTVNLGKSVKRPLAELPATRYKATDNEQTAISVTEGG